AAAEVRIKIIEGNFIKEKVRYYKIKNDLHEHLTEKIKEEVNELIRIKAESITDQFKEDTTEYNDFLSRTSAAISMLCELLIKGLEVYPSLKAPEETQKLSDDFRNLQAQYEEKVKELPLPTNTKEKNSDKEEDIDEESASDSENEPDGDN
ncbi:MAG: hypothetical protein V3S46_00800, partial [Nitrospinota bacterium]